MINILLVLHILTIDYDKLLRLKTQTFQVLAVAAQEHHRNCNHKLPVISAHSRSIYPKNTVNNHSVSLQSLACAYGMFTCGHALC